MGQLPVIGCERIVNTVDLAELPLRRGVHARLTGAHRGRRDWKKLFACEQAKVD
jgi:hypothetical protein